MAVNFTVDQNKAIKANGTVLVSAAAGSGKTAVLTERVISKICDTVHPISADRMLIVTFTNASALEMRTRIAKRLDEVCRNQPGNAYLLKQKLLLQNAKICTIDAFCIDLVKKYFNILGIKPDFKIGDAAVVDTLKDKAINDVLSDYFKNNSDDFNTLTVSFGMDRGDRRLIEAILKIYDYSMCMADPDKWLSDSVDNYNIDDFYNNPFVKMVFENVKIDLSLCIEKVIFVLREIVGSEFETKCIDQFNGLLDTLKNMNFYIDNKDWDGLYSASLDFTKPNFGNFTKVKDTRLKGIINDVKTNVSGVILKVKDIMTGEKSEVIERLNSTKTTVSLLVEITKRFKDRYFELLADKNVFTFAHIEQMALSLLCDRNDGDLVPSELSKVICKDYDEVLVDEYQDNNNLQDALFNAVSDNGKHLFMVGDVKQSIYGFRNANPDNFLRHKDNYPLYDGIVSPSKVILKSNFRSRKGICDFVNAFCGSVMQNETCNMEYSDEEMLVCGADFPDKEEPDVDLYVTDIKGVTVKREQADANAVADHILKLMSDEPFIKCDIGLRKADFGDFAILLRSPKSRAEYYVNALRERGIPVSYDTGDFYDTPEIITIMSYLKTIDNPTHDIALTSLMMSVIFGFSADEVASLKVKYNKDSVYANICVAAQDGDAHCKELLDKISKLRVSAATLSVSDLLFEIYNTTYISEIMSAFENGANRHCNLMRFLSLAADYDSSEGRGLGGFIKAFDHLADNDSKTSGTFDSSNTVKIMSIHGSKGLQFPICIIADCGGKFNMSDLKNSIIVNADYGIGIKYIDKSKNIKKTTVSFEAMSYLEKKKLIAEEIRLFYVAMTRAKDKLVLSMTLKNAYSDIESSAVLLGVNVQDNLNVPSGAILSATSYSKWIIMSALRQKCGAALSEYADVLPFGNDETSSFKTIIYKYENNEHLSFESETHFEDYEGSYDDKLIDEISSRFDFKYPQQNEVCIPSKLAVTELIKNDKSVFSFNLKPHFMSKAGLSPAERGTAAHKFFQYADYLAAKNDIEAEILRLYEYEYISKAEADSINVDNIRAFFVSDVYKRIENSSALYREYKFMIDYPFENSSTIVQGIADCIFEEAQGLVILDFKTDNVNDVSLLSDRYSEQLKIYKYAISKIFEKPVKECILYSLQLGKHITVEV